MRCSKVRCPMQHDTISNDCNIEECPYRTEEINPEKVMEYWCNHIADLVVKKLKSCVEDKAESEE